MFQKSGNSYDLFWYLSLLDHKERNIMDENKSLVIDETDIFLHVLS